MPPQLMMRLDRLAVLLETLHDDARAERGRLDPGAIHLGGGGLQRQAEDAPGQARVHQHGPVAVVPVQRQQAALARLQLRRALRQLLVPLPAGWMPLTNQLKMSPTADCPASRP